MIPKNHIIFGALISLILYFTFSLTLFQSLIIFLSSFLIDIDHYFYYYFIKKDFDFLNARKWFFKKRKFWISLTSQERKKYKRAILIFHGVEFWILILILLFFNKIFLFIFLGISIHLFFDYVEIFYFREPVYSKFSQVIVWIKNKNKELNLDDFL